jgi:hypothetical protein
MNLSFTQLLAGSVGALLIYCAIVGKTPVAVLKDAFANAQPPSGQTNITGIFGTAANVATRNQEGTR